MIRSFIIGYRKIKWPINYQISVAEKPGTCLQILVEDIYKWSIIQNVNQVNSKCTRAITWQNNFELWQVAYKHLAYMPLGFG